MELESRTLIPSFPAPSWDELEAVLERLEGVAYGFQVDLVDGQFVPHTSWPFTEADPVAQMARLAAWSPRFVIEADCMVTEPLQYLDALVAVGIRRAVVHMHSTEDYEAVIAHAEANNYRLSFGLTNDVPLEELEPYVDVLSGVQVMGIAAVGQQGQPFDERTIERVTTLRGKYPELEIAVDGSVNADTIPRLLAAGVNRFAPGSAITHAADPAAAYEQLAAMIA